MLKALSCNLKVVLVSASILAAAGFTRAGTLLGRGTILSFAMVVCVLPALLVLIRPGN